MTLITISDICYNEIFLTTIDSLINSLISSFIVEASIPFAFSLIAFSMAFYAIEVEHKLY